MQLNVAKKLETEKMAESLWQRRSRSKKAQLNLQQVRETGRKMVPAVVNNDQSGYGMSGIHDVWLPNLENELKIIQKLVDDYPVVALKVLKGLTVPVVQPDGPTCCSSDFQYQLMKKKVDNADVLQLGMTFMDKTGKLRPGVSVWQFNFRSQRRFRFPRNGCLVHPEAGSQRREKEGIEVSEFAELLISSGIVLNENIRCVSFDAATDFGHLIKWLTGKGLPAKEAEFADQLRTYFPVVYDVQYLAKSCKDLDGDLLVVSVHHVATVCDYYSVSQVSWYLGIQRVKSEHQAAGDSLMIAMIFFKMMDIYFENMIDYDKYGGHLFRLSSCSGIRCGGQNRIFTGAEDESCSRLYREFKSLAAIWCDR